MQNQRGFVSAAILIAIVLGLIVVGGGAYYVMHQSPSQSASDNFDNVQTLPTNSQTQQQTSNTSAQPTTNTNATTPTPAPKSTPAPTAPQTGTKTYTNSQYGFSFQYPSSLSVISPGKVYGEYSFHGFATQSIASVVSGPKSFSVYVSSNPNDVSNCLSVSADYSLPGYEGGNLAKMTTINGVQFAVFNGFENAAMGRSENGTVYNTVKNNACYSIDVRSITNRDDTQTYINSGSIIDSIIDSFSFGNASASQQSSIQVNGMTKYTDSNFGFSFWYPSRWTVQEHAPSKAPDTYFPGGVVQKSYNILDSNGNLAVSLSTVASDAGSITLQDDNGNTYTLYFDKSSHTWMRCLSKSGVAVGDCAHAISIAPADVSNNSMGGLHIISTVGSNSSGLAPDVVPLSAHNFVVVYHNVEKTNALAQTILALDPAVATPVSAAQQTQTIQAESSAYSY